MANVAVLGIDIAKNVFQLHGVDCDGQVALKRRVMRDQLLQMTEAMPPCLIGIEACTGAFHWLRHFESQGHTVKIIAPQYVKRERPAKAFFGFCEIESKCRASFHQP